MNDHGSETFLSKEDSANQNKSYDLASSMQRAAEPLHVLNSIETTPVQTQLPLNKGFINNSHNKINDVSSVDSR